MRGNVLSPQLVSALYYTQIYLGDVMADPGYQPDVSGLAAALQHEHGLKALDVAVETARRHMQDAAWKHCTMWLQVVNRLNATDRARIG